MPDTLAKSPKRAAMGEPTAVDFGALPVATEVPVGNEAATFSLRRYELTPTCPAGTEANTTESMALDVFSSKPLVMRVGAITLPAAKLLDGRHYDSSLEPLFQGTAPLPATWSALSPGRAHDAAEVTDFDGMFDRAKGRGTARAKSTVRATAIVDGVLYAYRQCTEYCVFAPGSTGRREELTLIGPPAVWAGSTDETSRQALDRRAPFTRITAPLRAGSSATIVLVALDGDIASFEKGLGPIDASAIDAEKSWTTYTIDVVWPDDSAEPTLNLFVGHTRGEPSKIRPDLANLVAEPQPTAWLCSPRPQPVMWPLPRPSPYR